MKVNGYLAEKLYDILNKAKYEELNPAIAFQYNMWCSELKVYLDSLKDLLTNNLLGKKFNEYQTKLNDLIYTYSLKDEKLLNKPSLVDDKGQVLITDKEKFKEQSLKLYENYKNDIELYNQKKEEFMRYETSIDLDIDQIKNKDIIKELIMYNRKDTPYKLSKTSKANLESCCKALQQVFNEVLYYHDISITQGYRDEKTQEDAYKKGTSKAHFGQSAHNYNPSLAIDVLPYPVPVKIVNGEKVWDSDSEEWDTLHNIVEYICNQMNIDLTWGGNFKTLIDKPHYEIKNWKELV